ncbi:MAG: O-acetyl-ADP-ribose deacetylase [Nocardioidaceae bacterium]|jgi:O-acetyl-ADP-ribose deacetylase (regulator of RNase III)|nr:O-acetyl-ADP-ribose deacetylase [Nocardioidaceae bacterium]
MDIDVVEGDITEIDVEAVVNAANSRMRGGGGVDGAIHAAAGPRLYDECLERFPDGLATGQAAWTHGHLLRARWVIHVVGPNYRAGERDRSLLVSCYTNALRVADELDARTVAFPLVSAGIYGWPRGDAIAAAVDTLRSTPTSVRASILVAFGRTAYEEIEAYLRSSEGPSAGRRPSG